MQVLPERIPVPSLYELEAMDKILAWRQPPPQKWYSGLVRAADETVTALSDLIRQIPGVDWTIDHVIAGLLHLTNEVTQDWIWEEGICREYRRAGYPVESFEDVRGVDLEVVDGAMSGLRSKYTTLAGAEGAATGFVGAPGIPADIFGLVALNLRAAGEMATYCGFDISKDSERLFALELLDRSAQPVRKADRVAMKPVVRVTRAMAQQQAYEVMEQLALTNAIKRVARSLGIHLTRAKLAQLVPVAGAVIGGGYNVYYTNRVTRAAYNMYRERFLLSKYGSDPFLEHITSSTGRRG